MARQWYALRIGMNKIFETQISKPRRKSKIRQSSHFSGRKLYNVFLKRKYFKHLRDIPRCFPCT